MVKKVHGIYMEKKLLLKFMTNKTRKRKRKFEGKISYFVTKHCFYLFLIFLSFFFDLYFSDSCYELSVF